jgi:hypothetical protein
MFLVSHRTLRGIVLGLMFFLAGTSCCWSNSYDPDPYDDIPPIVSVDFHYVVPSVVTVRTSKIQMKAGQRIAVTFYQLQNIAISQHFLNNRAASPLVQSASDLVIPLRR